LIGSTGSSGSDWPGGYSPSCERNQEPILTRLKVLLAEGGRVLEIGSGTGQHGCFFARALPQVVWQTSDQAVYLPGLSSNLAHHQIANVLPPVQLDVSADSWPAESFDALYTANTLHIMSWENVQQLFAGLQTLAHLPQQLIVYGPFNYNGGYTSDSNAAFDQSLKQRDPLSGIRDFDAVDELAEAAGYILEMDFEMPANNHLLVWHRKDKE